MRRMVDKIFRTYGTGYILLRQDGTFFALQAFLQPRKALSQRNAIKRVSPLGEIQGDTYLFICNVDCGMQAGDQIKGSGGFYEVRQVEKMYYKNDPIYLWGLCVQKGGTDNWQSQS